MEEKVISGLDGVSIYGIVSILIFAVFFTVTLIWAFGLKKNYLNHMGDLPLDGGEEKPVTHSNTKNL
jgi:hypothetical protein